MASNAHYAHVRYLGLGDRVTGTNEAPLRVVDGKLGVKRKGVILPVHAIDADGFAVVRIVDKAANALAQTPRTPEGGYDFDALSEVAPAITNPWDVPELAGLKTVGTKTDAAKPKASKAVAPEPKAVTPLRVNVGKPAQQPKAAKPASSAPVVDREAVIAYLSGISGDDMGAIVAALQAAKAKPLNQNRKGKARTSGKTAR